MARVLLVDDHAVVRKGLGHILRTGDDTLEIEEAENAFEALEKIRCATWDAAVIDIEMPGRHGIDLLKQIKKEQPSLPVLVLSVYPEEEYGVRVLKAGASGYLTKSSTPERLLGAVQKILTGKRYISPVLAEQLADELGKEREDVKHTTLSDREYEVFRMLALGKTSNQIAEELHLSVKTVYSYRARVLRKMSMKNNAEITHYAFRNGLMG